jgi:cytochrome P450
MDEKLYDVLGQKFAVMEEKVVVAIVLRHFKLTTSLQPNQLKLVSEMVLRNEGGLPIKLALRN